MYKVIISALQLLFGQRLRVILSSKGRLFQAKKFFFNIAGGGTRYIDSTCRAESGGYKL
jgi:hypothetical protein